MIDVAELIKRLELASDGSREIDVDIQRAIDGSFLYRRTDDGWWEVNRTGTVLTPVWTECRPSDFPRYTTSLDSAWMLVPDGMTAHVWGMGLNWKAQIEDASKPEPKFYANFRDGRWQVAHSGALALCIAALKARAA